jgi:hypothetical protein
MKAIFMCVPLLPQESIAFTFTTKYDFLKGYSTVFTLNEVAFVKKWPPY